MGVCVWFLGRGFYWSGLCMGRTGLFTEVCGHKRHITKSASWIFIQSIFYWESLYHVMKPTV